MDSRIIGHTAQRQHLESLSRTDHVGATFLFAGPESVGKALVAHEFARTILCSTPHRTLGGCKTCAECLLCEAGTHPDLHATDFLDKESSKTEAIRDSLRSLSLKPYRGVARVVILNNCEHLPTPAANILLKTLEEPLGSTTFILVAANVARLPRTILSRCLKVLFGPLQPDELGDIVDRLAAEFGPIPPALCTFSDGTVASLRLLASHCDTALLLQKQLTAVAQGSEVTALIAGEELANDKEGRETVLFLMRLIARHEMQQAQGVALQHQWSIFLLNVLTAERLLLERNLNAVTVFTFLLISLLPTDRVGSMPGGSELILSECLI
jgi:DNA polymerase III, delta subunit